MLRTFIEAGDTLHREDGFLTHDCTCDVRLHQTMWTHDLKCTRVVSSSQKITIPSTDGNYTLLTASLSDVIILN